MKKTRRIVSLVLIFMLVLAPYSTASAATAQYSLTRDFVSQVTEVDGVTCEVSDIFSASDGNYEPVRISYTGELSEYTNNITMLFAEDGSEVQLYMYNLIDFEEGKLIDVLKTVNDLNHRATGIKLYVDMSDYSVTAEMYQLMPEVDADMLALTAFGFMIGVTDALYPELQPYAVK